MNYFELNYNNSIVDEFNLFPRANIPKISKLQKYLEIHNIDHPNVEIDLQNMECWEFECNSSSLIFGYKISCPAGLQFFIMLYRKSRNQETSQWSLNTEINLSESLSDSGLQIKSILSCLLSDTSDILIIFFSATNSNILIRYDTKLHKIVDFLSFSPTSLFMPRLSISGNQNDLDVIVSPIETISIILISETVTNESIYCPSISDLQDVLDKQLVAAVQELFRFWLTNLSSISSQISQQPIDNHHFQFFHKGISVTRYINFLYVHHFSCLNTIWNRCLVGEADGGGVTRTTSNYAGNATDHFVEQLANLTSEYINDAVNVFSQICQSMGITLHQLKSQFGQMRRMLDILCDYGYKFRKLVFLTRWSLGTYKKISVNKVPISKFPENCRASMNKWDNADKNEIIKQALLNRQVAVVKRYFQKTFNENLSDEDIMNQTKSLILSNVNKCSWNDLTKLIKKLGYDPVQTLISLCLETDSKQIRDAIYSKLHHEMQDVNFRESKNIIDKLEVVLSNYPSVDAPSTTVAIYSSNQTDSSLYQYLQPFINKLDKSEYFDLRKIFTESFNPNESRITSHTINLKLSWFMEFYNGLNVDDGNKRLVNVLNLCLIDAEFKKLFSPIFQDSEESRKKLKLWFVKWKSQETLIVEYLVMAYDSDLIIAVINLDMEMNCNITNKIMDQFIEIIRSNLSNDLYTDVDRYCASFVMMYLFINHPDLLINKLVQIFPNDLMGASKVIFSIHNTLPIHYMCCDHDCLMSTPKIRDSVLLSYINTNAIRDATANRLHGEFPILLYYLLADCPNSISDLSSSDDSLVKCTYHFTNALKTGSKVDLFQSFLSQKLSNLDEKQYTMLDLDQIIYAALFSGISYSEITNSKSDVMSKVNKILNDNDYWNKLKNRLLRPRITDHETTNVEQYYEVNFYSFLHRSGSPLNLTDLFSWQSQNGFVNDLSTKHFPTFSYLENKHHSLFEISKYSLDYIYYLSLGRPFQAFMNIVSEFSDVRKQYTISQDVVKEIIKSIHQIALSNISNKIVTGGCFGLLRLIGSNTEPLRCYLTLANWIIEWHVNCHELNGLSESTGSQLNIDEIRNYYEAKIAENFKLCLSKKSVERRRNRDILLKKMEELFWDRLKNGHYSQLSEVLDAWSVVLYFCQLHGMEFSTLLLQYYAQENEWLLFLCCSQVFGYSQDQIKPAINKFKDACIRHHMSYIVSKTEEFSSMTFGKNEDQLAQSYRKTSLSNSKSKANPLSTSNIIRNIVSDNENKNTSKDSFSKKTKSHNKFNRSTLFSSAKDNLIELIFDCQTSGPSKQNKSENKSIADKIYLNSKKLLAFSLVLNHPFLSVLAYCSNIDDSEDNPVFDFPNYLNCVSCFILSSFPEKPMNEYWNKWDGHVKVEWTEDEFVDLINSAIKNKLAKVVADAFFIFQLYKYDCGFSFFNMFSHSVDNWNPIQRQINQADFINQCTSLCRGHDLQRDKHRHKIIKDEKLLFLNRVMEAALLTSINTIQINIGSRCMLEWLTSLSSESGLLNYYVRQLFTFTDINLLLLTDILRRFYDYIDLEKDADLLTKFEKHVIPVSVKSKEFVAFMENFVVKMIETVRNNVGYTKERLITDIKFLVNRVSDEVQTFPYDKIENLKSNVKSLEDTNENSDLTNIKSITDLLSIAFVGQNDRDEIIHLCMKNDQNNVSRDQANINATTTTRVNHGTTNSWRRLVIPEDWQEQIFSITDSTTKSKLEEISHVNCLLNEKKWIEACSYMIENDVYVKEAILILVSMNVACGKMDLNRLPSHIKSLGQSKSVSRDMQKTSRRGSIFSNSTNKLGAISRFEFDSSLVRGTRQINRYSQDCMNYIRNILEGINHGQEIVEYIYTIIFVANQMNESYLSVAKEEEFNVFTKILVGTCREKIDTSNMYLRVVNIDPDQLNRFLAEIIVQVLRSELQAHFSSTALSISSSSHSLSQKSSPLRTNSQATSQKDMNFTLSPRSSSSSKPSPSLKVQKTYYGAPVVLNSLVHQYAVKVAQRCQLRPELNTLPASKQSSESLLMKAFYLQDILKLTNCNRHLGKILYEYYKHFSQEVFSSQEEAEFLMQLLIQCHSCFTEGGDTVGISNCLKSAKELSKSLTSHSYFILLAQLMCRIGRYGEMPYVFAALIEHEHFELLLRKDMDKEGVIVPYILDYLNRNFSDDFDKFELVCHKYNCFYELAETKTKKSNSLIKKLRSLTWKNQTKESLKNSMSTIISNLLDSCKNYLKAGCYKKVDENFRKAQFYKLQQKWIDDPDKTFSIGSFSRSFGKSLKFESTKVSMPETGFSGGVRIIDMNSEQAMYFLKNIGSFYTAFIVIEQLKLSGDTWIELIVHHVVLNGDETYMLQFIEYFGRYLTSNFVQQCSNKLERLSTKIVGKQIANFRFVLQHSNDVFLIRRLSDKYQLNK